MSVLWAGRAGRGSCGQAEASLSGHTPDATSSCIPAGLAGWHVLPAEARMGFLEKHALLQRKADAPPPPSIPISVSILVFELKSKRRRSLIAQQGGSAFVGLLFLRNKRNQFSLQKKSLNNSEQFILSQRTSPKSKFP